MRSYVAEDTCVVCTNMMSSTPKKLVHIHAGKTNYDDGKLPLLNEADLKIDLEFVCKNPQKMWGGFGAMLLGVAVGVLLTAAVVATGGTALLVIGAVVAVGGVVSIETGKALSKHACDVISSMKWLSVHNSVNIDNKAALLHTSIINCSQGGVVSIIPDPQFAQQVASEYASNNNQEVHTHQTSQFLQGAGTGVAFLGSPVAAVLGLGLGSYFYLSGESDSQERQAAFMQSGVEDNSTVFGDVFGAAKQEAAGQTVGAAEGAVGVVKDQMIPINQGLNGQVARLGSSAAALEAQAAEAAARGLTEEAAEASARAANARLAQDIASRSYRMPWTRSAWRGLNYKSMVQGVGAGLSVAVVNFIIERDANEREKSLLEFTRQRMILTKAETITHQNLTVRSVK